MDVWSHEQHKSLKGYWLKCEYKSRTPREPKVTHLRELIALKDLHKKSYMQANISIIYVSRDVAKTLL